MRTLQRIEDLEAEEATILIEKLNALNNLSELIEDRDDKNTLYHQCVKERLEVENAYHEWWNKIIYKYKLDVNISSEMMVDTVKKIIGLV